MKRRRAPPHRPESQRWRWCVLNALDLVGVWGRGPLTRHDWIARYRPTSHGPSAERAWVRMLEGLREVGVYYTTRPTGGDSRPGERGSGNGVHWELTLEPGALVRVAQLARVLDDWLCEQAPIGGARAREQEDRWLEARRARQLRRKRTA